MIQVKRIYAPPSPKDGYRVLVDRLWPRGVTKAKAHLDEWCKDIAPSDMLRTRFHHDPAHWTAFKQAYFRELAAHEDLVAKLKKKARGHTLTLLYGAKDEIHNNAVALKDYLEQ